MKTKSALWYVCVIATLLASSAAFAEILSDGYWEGDHYGDGGSSGGWWTYSEAGAGANSYENTYSWGCGEGWKSVWTTETAWLTGSCSVYAWGEAHVDPDGESGDCAGTSASASGHVYGSEKFLSVGASNSDHDSPPARTFPAGQGVNGSHDAAAAASCVPDGGGSAYSHACANVSAYLHN